MLVSLDQSCLMSDPRMLVTCSLDRLMIFICCSISKLRKDIKKIEQF